MFNVICRSVPSVPSRHGGTLNSRRAASPLVRLVQGEERWEASDQPQSVLPLNWGGTEPNRTVTCMVLKAAANDRRHCLCRSGGISNNNNVTLHSEHPLLHYEYHLNMLTINSH
ncbi:uncharacterized protein TNCV_423311 [Trichonephila clavipes]|nr:uncharacterized protein TNCV_423311 [Trichonephila clavipes]